MSSGHCLKPIHRRRQSRQNFFNAFAEHATTPALCASLLVIANHQFTAVHHHRHMIKAACRAGNAPAVDHSHFDLIDGREGIGIDARIEELAIAALLECAGILGQHVAHFRQAHGFDLAFLPLLAEFALANLHNLAGHLIGDRNAVFALGQSLVIVQRILGEKFSKQRHTNRQRDARDCGKWIRHQPRHQCAQETAATRCATGSGCTRRARRCATAAHPKQTSQLAEEPTDARQFCQESACLCQAGNLR
jgi:hypothetical protein